MTLLVVLFINVLNATCQDVNLIFNQSAEQYVHGHKEEAKKIVESGLLKHPNDPKLNELLALLNKEDEDSESNSKDQESGDDKQDPDNKQDKDSKDPKSDEKDKESEKPKPENGDEEKDGQKQPEPQPIQLTPREAEQMLEAAKNEDQQIQMKLKQKQKGQPKKIEKDW